MSVLVQHRRQYIWFEDAWQNLAISFRNNKGCSHTSAYSKDEDTDDERGETLSALQDAWESTKNLNYMSRSTDEHTNNNGFIATNLGICKPGPKYWQRIGEKSEKKYEGVRELQTLS
jgi:hypothetical protein